MGTGKKLPTRSEGEVDKGGEVEGVGRSRRSRILIFARPRRASLTIFGWWLGPPPVLQVEPGSSSGLHTSHPLEPQNLKCPMCCPAPTVITSEPGGAAAAAIISAEAMAYNISEDPLTLPLFACLL